MKFSKKKKILPCRLLFSFPDIAKSVTPTLENARFEHFHSQLSATETLIAPQKMTTAAFRSTSRRSSIGGGDAPADDGSSSDRLRRSRSLSRCSGRFPPPSPELEEFPTTKERFVNKIRGSEFPEISLGDLADEFFRARTEEEGEVTSGRRVLAERLMAETESSRRRGRSASRHRCDSAVAEGKRILGNRGNSRPRRSVSVARSRRNELEIDRIDDCISNNKGISACQILKNPSLHKQTCEGHNSGQSNSQKDFFQLQDSCSSHSSSLTDDEALDAPSSKSLTLRAVYAQGKTDHNTKDLGRSGLYEAMRKEVRNVVEELRTDLEKVMGMPEHTAKLTDDGTQSMCLNASSAIAELRRSCSDKLEKSEKRKQDLLAKLAIEEQRGKKLSKIVSGLLLSPKPVAEPERSSRSRQRTSNKVKISRCLTEEAERYFEDFLSNMEDTDLSSFDGERSDTGSNSRARESMNNDVAEVQADLLKAASLPAETDGVVFPWLQWETSNCSSPSLCKSRAVIKHASGTLPQESDSVNWRGSLGSRSSKENEGFCEISGELSSSSRHGEVESQMNASVVHEGPSYFDMDECLQLQRRDDLLFEMWELRQRIASGSMLLCGRTLF